MSKAITHLNFAKGFRGGERQTQLLIQELALQGWEQNLIVRKNSELGKRCQKIQNLTIIEISKPYFFSLPKVKNAALLHAHETKAAQFAFFANLHYNIPYIITRRVDNPISVNLLNRLIYTRSCFTVALSHAIKREVLNAAPATDSIIIPSAFTGFVPDNNKVNLIKQRFENKFLIGHVGALDNRHKGQSTIIEVAKMVEKSYPNFHFLFVGRGNDEEMLKNLSLGLSNITFEGFVDNVGDYLSAIDLFVFPSNNEGLGSILFDVMYAHTPIIASDVGGIPDIIKDGYNGFLIPPRDSKALMDAIIQLYGDEDIRQRFVENALDELLHFSPDAMRLSYENLYTKVLRN